MSNKAKKLTEQAKSAAQNSVPISIKTDTSDAALQTAASVGAVSFKTNCWNAIEKAAAQVILRELTRSTVNWINSGFNGSAWYAVDTKDSIADLRDKAIRTFISRDLAGSNVKPTDIAGFLRAQGNYVFGKGVAQSLVRQLQSDFSQRAKYSLDAVLYSQNPTWTHGTFEDNFAKGGWTAFGAQFSLGNNPIGYQYAAQSELASRLLDYSYSPVQDFKDQLQRSGGFLDMQKCVSPIGYTQDDARVRDLERELAKVPANDTAQIDAIKRDIAQHTCARWEVQTPGSVISSTLEKALGTSFDQLVIGQDLNASLTAIFNALINQLAQKGLSYLSQKDTTQTNYSNNGNFISNISVLNGSGYNAKERGGSWLDEGESFNIFSDLPRIIANEDNPMGINGSRYSPNEPRGYKQIMIAQRDTTEQLVSLVYKLDYCVPGPRPYWENEAGSQLQNKLQGWPTRWTSDPDVLESIGMILDPADIIHGGIVDAATDGETEKMYAKILTEHLSYRPKHDGEQVKKVQVEANLNTNGYAFASEIMTTLFKRYSKAVSTVYNPVKNLDFGDLNANGMLSDDQKEYLMIPQYLDGIADNESLIAQSDSTVHQLQNLQDRINKLKDLPGYLTPEQKLAKKISGSSQPRTEDNTEGSLVLGNGTTQTGGTTGTAQTATERLAKQYQQDLLELKADKTKKLTNMTPYEVELKKIDSTFTLIAPYIHGSSDLAEEEDTFSAVSEALTKVNDSTVECIKLMTSPESVYTGPRARIRFPADIERGYIFTNDDLGKKIAALPASTSFLPGFYYGQGQAADQIEAFSRQYGFKQDPNYVIQNDIADDGSGLVTISYQQNIPGTLAGLEYFVGMY